MSAKKLFVLEKGQHEPISHALRKAITQCYLRIDLIPFNLDRELKGASGLVIPRGSSMEYSRMLWQSGFNETIFGFVKSGASLLVLCGGLIVAAQRLGKCCDGRRTLSLLDIAVDNDAIAGDHNVLLSNGLQVLGDFRNAPAIRDLGKNVQSVAVIEGRIVGVKENDVFGFSYFDQSGTSYVPFLLSL